MRIFQRPLVSAIIASYNHAPFVESAVNSVLNQGLKNLEVIVVDDGSDDGTPDLIENIGDPRVRVIRSQENRRVHPRNLALGLAQGRYIAFQNSDDVWASGKLAAQLEILEHNRNIVACFTGVEIIGKNGRRLTRTWANGIFCSENRPNTTWLRHFFDVGNCLCISSAVIRRPKIEAVGRFRPSLIQLSDLDLWVRLAALGDFYLLDQPLTNMRVIPQKNISRPSPDVTRRSAMELAEVLGRYAENPVLKHIPVAFREVIPQQAESLPAQLAGLAVHAWTLGSPAHLLFADRVLARLFDDPATRGEITHIFGTQLVHEFIKKRGELELIIKKEKQ